MLLKKILPKLAISAVALFSLAAILLFLTRSNFIVLRIPLDDTIRPRTFCVMNPFRNQAAEQLAEIYLHKLREGDVEVIAPFVGANNYILDNERKWPIRKWRVRDLKHQNGKYEIMYWVNRGNGYDAEEEAYFGMEQTANGLKLVTYSAIY